MTVTRSDQYGSIEVQPFIGIRKSISQRLKMTTASVAMVTHFDFADVSAVHELRQQLKKENKNVSYMPFLIKAVTNALTKAQHKSINSELNEATEAGEILFKKYYNIGIAVDTERGLMVPVIMHADKLNVLQLSAALAGIAKRARDRSIKLEEMRGGTFTITNVGAVGGAFSTPIMNYPQSCILGLGKITDEAMVRDGTIIIGKRLPLFLSFDHRLVDGADAARFLNDVMEALKKPENLL